MGDIGQPKRIIEIVPLEEPATAPAEPEPATAPEPAEPEKVPA